MNCTEEPFLITVNLAKVLQNEKDSVFTMLVDHTKMTIVYEVKEWIRWMFSLPHCLNLTYGGTVIHDLEDIKILARLKKFELNFCGVKCFHQNLNKNLLDKLGFYVSWNEAKVPKFFVEKLNSINQKLNYSKHSKEAIELQPQKTQNEVCLVSHDSFFSDRTMDFQSFTNLNCADSASKCIKKADINQKPNDCNEVGSSNQSNLRLEPQSILLQNSKTQLSPIMANFVKSDNREISDYYTSTKLSLAEKSSNHFLSETKPCDAPNMKNFENDLNSNEISIDKPENNNTLSKVFNKKRKKFIKPFSLAEVVASLQKTENKTNQPNNYISKNPLDNQNGSNSNFAENTDFGKESEVIKKKRKRIRKNKNKSLPLKENRVVSSSMYNVNNYHTVGVKAPSHIRFQSSSEDEENNINVCKNSITESKNENNYLTENCDINTIFNHNDNKPIILQDSEENKLFSTNFDNMNENSNNLIDSAPTIKDKELQKENDLIFLDDQMINGIKDTSNGFSTTIDPAISQSPDEELSFLKRKFPFPVVFERFS